MNDSESASHETVSPTVWECFATAVHFLTRLTISKRLAASADFNHARALNRSVVFFPLVGGLIGLATASFLSFLLLLGLPPLLAAFLALGAEAYVTGAFHEDAFADTCDALGGGWTRERVLEIMKDSRLGTYGTMGLVIGVASRAIAMSAIAAGSILWTIGAMVAAAMISRLVIVLLMATTAPIAGRDSQARDVSGTQSLGRVFLAVLIALPLGLPWMLCFPWTAAGSLCVCAFVLYEYRRVLLRRLGGTTGDTLGASGFIAQIIVLAGATTA